MPGRTGRANGKRQLARMRLAIGNQALEVLHRQVFVDGYRQRGLGDQRQRHKVARHVVVRRLHGHRGGGESGRVKQQGVAVGRRLGHRVAAYHALATGLVFDKKILTRLLCQLLGQHAPYRVQRTAGRKRNDHPDRLARPGLRHGGGTDAEQGRGHQGAQELLALHGVCLLKGAVTYWRRPALATAWRISSFSAADGACVGGRT